MADQQQDPQQSWNGPAGLDNFDYRASNPHSALSAQTSQSASASASASASGSPSEYQLANGTAAHRPNSEHIPSSGPDPGFADYNANPAWTEPNQFTPPLAPNEGDPFDALNLFPDSWNVPTASFPNQSLQYRPRLDGLPQSHDPQSLQNSAGQLFAAFMNSAAANQSGDSSSRPGPINTGIPTLTPAQQQQLRNIAMPPSLQYQSPKSELSQPSPSSSNGDALKATSPDPSKLGSRKRKSSADDDDLDDDDDDDSQHPVKKTAHNMIEKRYRTNLNDKIAALRDSVPSLRVLSKSARGEDTTEDREELHGLTPAHKLNKATVLSKATEYIRHLEKRNNRLTDENGVMQQRISAFEKLFMASAMNGTMSPIQNPSTPMQFGQDASQFMNTPVGTPRGMDPQGMIPVPDDMKRIISAQLASGRPYPVPQQSFQQNPAIMRQQQIQQQQQMQANRWQNASPYFGKFMVGSLAGLMMLEAVRENEQSNESPEGRGLFAIPLQLLRPLVAHSHVSIAGYHFSLFQIISTLKSLLIIGALLWVFVPSLFAPRPPRTEKTAASSANLQKVPSLASPIHVRRQAWLTAIQTVWVPRHNFFLEAAALMLKTMKLSLRNTIGIHGYQVLTGLTEEQETARVKAWTIALDAQLAGGDVEINKSRLTLTLLASQTLPDTPLRLMLNALHIRVLLWQLDKQGIHNILAAKLARSMWNEARQLHRLNNSLRRSGPASPDEDLPEHLALLVEQDCDDVMNANIVQRANNLAWNRPTTHGVDVDVDGMNAVVEDPAVRSPLDALAAWWSSLMLQRVLSASLECSKDEEEESRAIGDDLNLAVKVAPVGSNAQVRALVAKAILVEEKRGANIAIALKAMGPTLNPDKHPHISRGVPPLVDSPMSFIIPDPDVQMALRCGMAIAHLQRFEAPPHSALSVIDGILPGSSKGLSLLGCTAAFHLMARLHGHAVAAEACATSLERLAGTLRIWIGSAEGDRPGLSRELRGRMVERCLTVTKSTVGMVEDQGYVTMSECDSEESLCSPVVV